MKRSRKTISNNNRMMYHDYYDDDTVKAAVPSISTRRLRTFLVASAEEDPEVSSATSVTSACSFDASASSSSSLSFSMSPFHHPYPHHPKLSPRSSVNDGHTDAASGGGGGGGVILSRQQPAAHKAMPSWIEEEEEEEDYDNWIPLLGGDGNHNNNQVGVNLAVATAADSKQDPTEGVVDSTETKGRLRPRRSSMSSAALFLELQMASSSSSSPSSSSEGAAYNDCGGEDDDEYRDATIDQPLQRHSTHWWRISDQRAFCDEDNNDFFDAVDGEQQQSKAGDDNINNKEPWSIPWNRVQKWWRRPWRLISCVWTIGAVAAGLVVVVVMVQPSGSCFDDMPIKSTAELVSQPTQLPFTVDVSLSPYHPAALPTAAFNLTCISNTTTPVDNLRNHDGKPFREYHDDDDDAGSKFPTVGLQNNNWEWRFREYHDDDDDDAGGKVFPVGLQNINREWRKTRRMVHKIQLEKLSFSAAATNDTTNSHPHGDALLATYHSVTEKVLSWLQGNREWRKIRRKMHTTQLEVRRRYVSTAEIPILSIILHGAS